MPKSEAQAKQLAELQAALAAKEQEVQEACAFCLSSELSRDFEKPPGPSIESGFEGDL